MYFFAANIKHTLFNPEATGGGEEGGSGRGGEDASREGS